MMPSVTNGILVNGTLAPPPAGTNSYQPSHAFVICMVVIQTIVIVVALFGNILVCTAILVHERLRNTTTNYFIFSLALSDIITASIAMPFDVDQTLNGFHWTHGEAMCNVFVITYLIAAPLSILNLLAVSVDRYHAITQPLHYTHIMTPRVVLVSIITLWTYSILFTAAAMAGWPLYPKSVQSHICHFNIQPFYSLVSSVVNFIIPTIIMCVLYYRIYKVAHAHAHRIGRLENFSNTDQESSNGHISGSERRSIKRNIKAAKTIAIIVSAFLFCWMPHTLVSCAAVICKRCFYNAPYELYVILLLLAYTNSALNPFLYAFHNRDFRESFRRLFKLQFRFI